MSWETVYSWSQIFVVVFAGFALVSGLIVNKRQSREIAFANERTAKAELELEKLKLTRRERFNRDAFREEIRGKPKIRVELLFQKDDVDSYTLEETIKGCLNAEGWTVIGPRPIREEDLAFSEIDKDAPASVRAGAAFGFAYISNSPQDHADDPINVLLHALTVSRRGFGVREPVPDSLEQLIPTCPTI